MGSPVLATGRVSGVTGNVPGPPEGSGGPPGGATSPEGPYGMYMDRDQPLSGLGVGERSNLNFFPTHTQDHGDA